MKTLWNTANRRVSFVILVIMAIAALAVNTPGAVSAQADATPTPTWSCDDISSSATPSSTDRSTMDTESPVAEDMNMDTESPAAEDMDMDMDLDLLYIDMMIPHHASIIALAQAALPRLTDERVIAVALNIIDSQSKENTELLQYRETFYGSAEVIPMDEHMMEMAMEMMPDLGSMEAMTFQMDAEAQVSAFCPAENPNLAFIDQVIPHHEMAVKSSEPLVFDAVHPEVKAFAERVIEDQGAEIDILKAIKGSI